jgi:ELWxxDGT repeat protein
MSVAPTAVRGTHRIRHTAIAALTAALTLALWGVLLAPGTAAFAVAPSGCGAAAPNVRTTAAAATSSAPASVSGTPLTAPSPGAILVRDPDPGGYADVTRLVAVGDRLFFRASDGVHGIELWVSDGTTVGTHMVRDIRAGSRGSKPNDLLAVGDRLFFSAIDATHGREMWVSDGTSAGTRMVRDIRSGSRGSSPGPIVVMDGVAYFPANDQTHGVEVWRSNGTSAGTRLVRDVSAGRPGGIDGLTVMRHRVYYGSDDDLWVTDGTRDGTHSLMPGWPADRGFGITSTAVVGTRLFLGLAVGYHTTGCAGGAEWSELWRTDGTRAGTRMLHVTALQGGDINDLVELHGRLYFVSPYDEGHRRLWRSDGTGAGTAPIRPKGFPGDVDSLYVAAGRLYFTTQGETWFWSTDGSAGGEHRLTGLGTDWWVGGAPVSYQGRAWFVGDFFYAVGDSEGNEVNADIWSTDGTNAGTRQETYLGPGTRTSAYGLTVMGSELYFDGGDAAQHDGLWKLAP